MKSVATLRFLLGLSMLVLASAAWPDGRTYRIGMLETRSSTLNAANVDAFLQGLRELGYRENENLQIVYRSSDGHDDRFPGLARELVDMKVDLIVTRGTPAALAAKRATRTIPIVMAASADPVGTHIVDSLGHPGGNVTGASSGLTDAFAKRVELLKDLLPQLHRVAAIFNMGNPVIPPQWEIVKATAHSLGIEPLLPDVRQPADLSSAFDAAVRDHAEALVVGLDGVTQANLRPIAHFALAHRLPSIYPEKAYATLGGLMSYGASDRHMYHLAASFADRLFKGARPQELPVEQPTEFELVVNLKTAKAMALSIPAPFLLRTTQVIQ